jgi:hypothetical protein
MSFPYAAIVTKKALIWCLFPKSQSKNVLNHGFNPSHKKGTEFGLYPNAPHPVWRVVVAPNRVPMSPYRWGLICLAVFEIVTQPSFCTPTETVLNCKDPY